MAQQHTTEWEIGTQALAKALEIRKTTARLEIRNGNEISRAHYALTLAVNACNPYEGGPLEYEKQAALDELVEIADEVRSEYSKQLAAKVMAEMRAADAAS